jgi:hypothetical protein
MRSLLRIAPSLLLLTGCLSNEPVIVGQTPSYLSAKSSSSSSVGALATLREDAFRETVFTLTSNYCASCHVHRATHGSTDAAVAFRAIIDQNKVNTSDFTKSLLISRLKVDNHNCWDTCDESASQMEAAIYSWFQKSGVATDSKPAIIPGKVSETWTPTSTQGNKTVEFMFTEAGIPVSILLDFTNFDAGAVTFAKPRLKFLSPGKVSIKSLRVLINSDIDSAIHYGNTFMDVDKKDIPSTGTAAELSLSTAATMVLKQNGLGQDNFRVQVLEFEYSP